MDATRYQERPRQKYRKEINEDVGYKYYTETSEVMTAVNWLRFDIRIDVKNQSSEIWLICWWVTQKRNQDKKWSRRRNKGIPYTRTNPGVEGRRIHNYHRPMMNLQGNRKKKPQWSIKRIGRGLWWIQENNDFRTWLRVILHSEAIV